MLRSQRETRRRRKKSSRIPSRGSQESSASSTERAVWTKRRHELNTVVREQFIHGGGEVDEYAAEATQNQAALASKQGQKESGARGRGERQPSIPYTYGRKGLSHRLAKQRMCMWISSLLRR